MVAKHVIFSGHVQGVGFRFTVHRIAGRHRLAGFVRNLSDGTVEMLAQGTSEDIEECVQDIKEAMASYLSETAIDEVPLNPKYTDFRITF